MPSLILVVGGTGMLGEPVARRLLADGMRVRILTRSLERAKALWGNEAELVAGDVEDPPSLARALKDCQGVHVNLRNGADPDVERRGAQHVAQAAAQAGLQRISYLSGASVFAENCWFAGTKAKFEAETAIKNSGVPYSIFKAGWFMESLDSFIRTVGGKTRALQFGYQPHPYHWVAAEDYASMVSRAYCLPEAANKEFFVYGPSAYTMRQALETYCRIAHPDATFLAMPIWVARIVARLARSKELQANLSFFRYMECITEGGDPSEANALLGAPTTTLEQWSQRRRSVL